MFHRWPTIIIWNPDTLPSAPIYGGCLGIDNTVGEHHVERPRQYGGANQDPESSFEPGEFLCAGSVTAGRECVDQHKSEQPVAALK